MWDSSHIPRSCWLFPPSSTCPGQVGSAMSGQVPAQSFLPKSKHFFLPSIAGRFSRAPVTQTLQAALVPFLSYWFLLTFMSF